MALFSLCVVVVVVHGCTNYFTDSARNISRREVGAAVGVSGLCPQWVQGQGPCSGGYGDFQSPPEADDDLLIQQQFFCGHSYVYAERQL